MLWADVGLEQRFPTARSDSYPTPCCLLPPCLSGLPQLRAPSGPHTWARPGWSQGMFVTEQKSRCCEFLVGSDLPRGTQRISFSEEPRSSGAALSSCPAQGAARFRSAPELSALLGEAEKLSGFPVEEVLLPQEGLQGDRKSHPYI